MSEAEDERRRTSFGTLVDAAAYDDLRPAYPDEAVAWLTGGLPATGSGAPGRRLRVLDVGAGTGKLTRALLAHGHEVVAVDPSPGMRAALAAATPGADVVDGTAERLPLPDASVDAITIAQAWHWVRPGPASVEVARVLRPGGVLGLAWNDLDDTVPWVRDLHDVVRGGRLLRHQSPGAWPTVGLPLGARERFVVRAAHRLPSVEAVVALAATFSGVATAADPVSVRTAVRSLAASAARPDGAVHLPLVCRCYRFRRP